MAHKESCGLLFKKINDALERQANNDLRNDDLTLTQMGVLVAVEDRFHNNAMLGELVSYLGVSQPTMTGIVNRLEKKGCVTSFTNKGEGRIRRVSLTEKGMEKCRMAKGKMEAAEELILSGLDEEEQAELLVLLKKVARAVEGRETGSL